jgi:hypothetical protein
MHSAHRANSDPSQDHRNRSRRDRLDAVQWLVPAGPFPVRQDLRALAACDRPANSPYPAWRRHRE